MDSLFKFNPKGCLMILSKSMDSGRSGYRILKPLLDRGFKLKALTPDLPFLVKNTPERVAGVGKGSSRPGGGDRLVREKKATA
ncbi:hypothetical protein ACE6H2_012295 [Prunus campanulata]